MSNKMNLPPRLRTRCPKARSTAGNGSKWRLLCTMPLRGSNGPIASSGIDGHIVNGSRSKPTSGSMACARGHAAQTHNLQTRRQQTDTTTTHQISAIGCCKVRQDVGKGAALGRAHVPHAVASQPLRLVHEPLRASQMSFAMPYCKIRQSGTTKPVAKRNWLPP